MENIKQLIRGKEGEFVAYYDEQNNKISLSPIRFWAVITEIEEQPDGSPDYVSDTIKPLTADFEDMLKGTSDTSFENGLIPHNALGIVWGANSVDVTNPDNWKSEIAQWKKNQALFRRN